MKKKLELTKNAFVSGGFETGVEISSQSQVKI